MSPAPDTDTTTAMVCFVCDRRIYRKPGAAVVHLFPVMPNPGRALAPPTGRSWAHAACADRRCSLHRLYQYPWGQPE